MHCRKAWLSRFCALTISVVACAEAAAQDNGARQQDWRFYGSDAASSKYVPLAQINAGNVAELEVAWVWDTPDNAIFRQDDRASAGEYKSTPIMIGGVLYVSTSLGQVAAIDGHTDELYG